MNYDQTLNQIIEALTADKSIPQPYRNSVASSARKLQLEIRGAKTMTRMQPPEGEEFTPVVHGTAGRCSCPFDGVWDKSCPMHGGMVTG